MRGKNKFKILTTQTGCAKSKDECTHQKRVEIMALIGDKTDRPQIYKSWPGLLTQT